MFHTIILVGNIGQDPEMRYTPTGQAVTTFSVAVNRNYKDSKGEQVKETIWFRVTAWGKLAETCSQFAQKGRQVLVEGRLQPDLNTHGPRVFTRKDGTTGASYEVVASTVRFIGRREESTGAPAGEDGVVEAPAISEEDIPF